MDQPHWGQSRTVDGAVQTWTDDGMNGYWKTAATPRPTAKNRRDSWAIARIMMGARRPTRRPPATRGTRSSRATTQKRTAAHRPSRRTASSGSSSPGESGKPTEPPPHPPRSASGVEHLATASTEVVE